MSTENYRNSDSFPTRLENTLKYCGSERILPPRYSEATRIASRKASRNHRLKYPEREKARQKAHGLPLQPCSVCASPESVHRHHPDYTKPLDIVYLCRTCHAVHHRKEISHC